jgi:hypothetical protein
MPARRFPPSWSIGVIDAASLLAMRHKRTIMGGLVACGLALLVQHVAELGQTNSSIRTAPHRASAAWPPPAAPSSSK